MVAGCCYGAFTCSPIARHEVAVDGDVLDRNEEVIDIEDGVYSGEPAGWLTVPEGRYGVEAPLDLRSSGPRLCYRKCYGIEGCL